MLGELEGRTAVITGAGAGIGREVAIALDRLGMRLALLDVDPDRLAESVALLTSKHASRTYVVDVGDQAEVEDTAADILSSWGAPAYLVTSAGRMGSFTKRVWDYSNAEWNDLMSVNLYGVINMVRAFLPGMRATSELSHLSIIASANGLIPGSTTAPYFSSKHALVALAENLDLELRAEGSPVGVSLVCPGAVRTDFNLAARRAGNVDDHSADWLGPQEVAARLIADARAGRFYVFTHAGLKTQLAAYQQRLIAAFDGS